MKIAKKIASLTLAVAIGVSSMSMLANANYGSVLCKTKSDLKGALGSNADIVLANDIDMENDMESLKNVDYKRTFDGKGHTIKNMNRSLVEYMHGATFKNVTLDNVRAQHGAVAEKIYDNTLIENVTVRDSKITGKDNLGAITGASRRSKIINCENENTEIRNAYNGAYGFEGNTGGIVGYMKDTEVDGCYTSACHGDGDIYTENENCGGIVGKASNSTVTNCRNNATIISELDYVMTGGIVGLATYTKVKNCLNTGEVKEGYHSSSPHLQNYKVGGIVGRCGESKMDSDDYALIQTCFDASIRESEPNSAHKFNPIYGQNYKNAKAYECAYLCPIVMRNADDDAPGKRFNAENEKQKFVNYAHKEIARLNEKENTNKYKMWSASELLHVF